MCSCFQPVITCFPLGDPPRRIVLNGTITAFVNVSILSILSFILFYSEGSSMY